MKKSNQILKIFPYLISLLYKAITQLLSNLLTNIAISRLVLFQYGEKIKIIKKNPGKNVSGSKKSQDSDVGVRILIRSLVLTLQAKQAASWQPAWGWLAAVPSTGPLSNQGYVD